MPLSSLKLPAEVRRILYIIDPDPTIGIITNIKLDETGHLMVPPNYYHGRVLKRRWVRDAVCPKCHNKGSYKAVVYGEDRSIVCDNCMSESYGHNEYTILMPPSIPIPLHFYKQYGSSDYDPNMGFRDQ